MGPSNTATNVDRTDDLFINPEWIQISKYPSNYIPPNCEEFSHIDEYSSIKGFYDPDSEELHIQEFMDNFQK